MEALKGSSQHAITLRTIDDGTVHLDATELETLRSCLEGEVLTPADDGFEAAVSIWNGMVTKRPALAARPASVDDVVLLVQLAAEHRLLLSIKGGGHNIAGTALADGGLTLDMSGFRDVAVDPEARTAEVGAGCLLGDVDQATQAHGLAVPLGFISETGVAGLTLGGGLGYLTRRFGFTVDNLLEVEIVTADGRVRRVNRDQEPDLFWALRGGGGNFGVVTSFVYQLHPVGPTITGGVRVHPAETALEIDRALAAYRDLTERAPRELTVFCELALAPPLPFLPEAWHGRRVALFLVCHSGALKDAAEDLAPLSEALGEPIADVVAPRPYAEQQSLVNDGQPPGLHYYWRTAWVTDLSDDLLRTVRDLVLVNPVPGAHIGFLHVGGALNERAPDDGAVGNRDARFAMGITGKWSPDDPEGPSYQTWVRNAAKRFEPYSTGAAYINFLTEDEPPERTAAFYGRNLARLAEVKAAVDPDNLFRTNRNVAPAP